LGEGEAAGVPDFRNREAVEAWLRTQPREVGVVIAARAALRVALLAIGYSQQGWPHSVMLPVFRATAAAMFAVTQSSVTAHALRSAASAASSAADLAAADHAVKGALGFAASEAALAAAGAAAAGAEGEAGAIAAAAYASAYSAAEAAASIAPYSAAPAAHIAVTCAAAAEDDALAIADGALPANLRTLGLWANDSPDWVTIGLIELRAALPPHEDWQVWIDWYEARLRGDPYDEELEECYVLIPEEIWAQGPAVANDEIARRIKAYREWRPDPGALRQFEAGAHFAAAGDELRLAAAATGPDAVEAALRAQLRAAAETLAQRLKGSNQFGELADHAAALVATLTLPPDQIESQAVALWTTATFFADYQARDDAAARRDDGFAEALDPDGRRALDTAARLAAVHARSFPEGRALDASLAAFSAPPPRDPAPRELTEHARRSAVLAQGDADVLLEAARLGEGDGPLAVKTRAATLMSARNLVIASASLVATAFVGQIAADAATHWRLGERAARFLEEAGNEIGRVMADAPPDVRRAVEATRQIAINARAQRAPDHIPDRGPR
jgi:hypothetical protein